MDYTELGTWVIIGIPVALLASFGFWALSRLMQGQRHAAPPPPASGAAPGANQQAGGPPPPAPKKKWVGWAVGGAVAIAAILVITLVVIPMLTDGTVAAIDWEMLLIWSIPVLAVVMVVVGLANFKERKPLAFWGAFILVICAFLGASGILMLRSKVQTAISEMTITEVKPTSGAVRESTIVIGSTPVRVEIPSQMCVGLSPASKLNITYSGQKNQSEYMMASSKDGNPVTVRVRHYTLPNPKC